MSCIFTWACDLNGTKKIQYQAIDLSWKHHHQWLESQTYYRLNDQGWIGGIVAFPPNHWKALASYINIVVEMQDVCIHELSKALIQWLGDCRNLSLLCTLLFQNQELYHDTYECKILYQHLNLPYHRHDWGCAWNRPSLLAQTGNNW